MSTFDKGPSLNPIVVHISKDMEDDLKRALDYRHEDIEDVVNKGIRKYIKEAFIDISGDYANDNINNLPQKEYSAGVDLGRLAGTHAGKAIDNIGAFPELSIEDKLKRYFNNNPCPINTYPFGTPTNEIYSQWLGVYDRFTDIQGLDDLIMAAKIYISKPNTDNTTTKDIVILTDIWDDFIERRLIDAFIEPYKLGDIRSVNIFFYDDENHITRIPFEMELKSHLDARGRNISKYTFDGQHGLPKTKTVLAVVRKYVSDHPGVTLASLQNIFQRVILGQYEICEDASNIAENQKHCFKVQPNEIITLDDGTDVAVCNQWKQPAFELFLVIAEQLGYKVVEED